MTAESALSAAVSGFIHGAFSGFCAQAHRQTLVGGVRGEGSKLVDGGGRGGEPPKLWMGRREGGRNRLPYNGDLQYNTYIYIYIYAYKCIGLY